MLANVSAELAQGVADGIGIGIAVPAAMPPVLANPQAPEVTLSSALSLMARTGDGSIKTHHVALLCADGIDGKSLRAVHAALAAAGAVPRFVGARLGRVRPGAGEPIHVEVTMETAPSVLWDGVVIPSGDAGLAAVGTAVDFIKDQYRHCKTILVLGAKSALVDRAMLPTALPNGSEDPGLVMAASGDVASAFIRALSRHRHYARETDPPVV
jgi:catalase